MMGAMPVAPNQELLSFHDWRRLTATPLRSEGRFPLILRTSGTTGFRAISGRLSVPLQ